MIAALRAAKTGTLGRAKRKGVGGAALAFAAAAEFRASETGTPPNPSNRLPKYKMIL